MPRFSFPVLTKTLKNMASSITTADIIIAIHTPYSILKYSYQIQSLNVITETLLFRDLIAMIASWNAAEALYQCIEQEGNGFLLLT